jgi:hypothetical protein
MSDGIRRIPWPPMFVLRRDAIARSHRPEATSDVASIRALMMSAQGPPDVR